MATTESSRDTTVQWRVVFRATDQPVDEPPYRERCSDEASARRRLAGLQALDWFAEGHLERRVIGPWEAE